MRSAYKTFPQYTTITDSGVTYTIQYDVFTVGSGYLDLQAAFSDHHGDDDDRSAKSPTAVYDRKTKTVHFLRDDSALWGSSAMWGSSTVWGESAFVGSKSAMWGSSALWGSSAMWGSSTASAFSALWGSSAMWGSGTNTPDPSVAVDGDK
jgi:serine protease AprX